MATAGDPSPDPAPYPASGHARRGPIPVPGHPNNAETPLAAVADVPTTPGLFYVRSNFGVPRLAPDAWRLRLDGEVDRPATLELDQLRSLGSTTVAATLECAGNGRRLMARLPPGTPWALGAVSTAEFTGVPLHRLLERARVRAGAVEVLFRGADRGEVAPGRSVAFERSLPLEAAGAPEVLLAWSMDGRPLSPEHGYPLRLVVPGWYGMASVKWLLGIRLLSEPFRGHFQADRYVYVGEDGVADGTPVTRTRVRSLIGRPADGARLVAGEIEVAGTAWSGFGRIRSVELSTDGGRSWLPASLRASASPHSATVWRWLWTPRRPGTYQLIACATDDAGNRQPLEPVRNEQGYGNNVVHRVTVRVV